MSDMLITMCVIAYNEEQNINGILEYYKDAINEYEIDISALELHKLICIVIFRKNKLMNLLVLSRRLNFTFDEIYQEYLRKNKINYERLKEWVELCNERHIKVIDFDYRNCTRDEAIAALDLLEEAHSIAFPNLYDEDNKQHIMS